MSTASDVAADGRYEIVREIGNGGMGRVFEARHRTTGRHVALKTLHDELLAQPRWLHRFLREARAVARIRHPHVIEVLDMAAGGDGQPPYIVYELLEGESLDARLRSTPDGMLPVDECLQILVPVAAALVAAHEAGVVHRDLKPSNVFLTDDARGTLCPKVIDFGLAKHSAEDITVTTSNVVLGTPAYMSPEQAASLPDVDAQADVWSFGATLYECLSGVLPFDGPNANFVLRRILSVDAPPIRAACPLLDADVAAVVDRCLLRDRAARFATMREVFDALVAADAWLRLGLDAPPIGATPRARPVRAPTRPPSDDEVRISTARRTTPHARNDPSARTVSEMPRPRPAPRYAVVVALVACAAVVGVTAAVWLSRAHEVRRDPVVRHAPPPTPQPPTPTVVAPSSAPSSAPSLVTPVVPVRRVPVLRAPVRAVVARPVAAPSVAAPVVAAPVVAAPVVAPVVAPPVVTRPAPVVDPLEPDRRYP